LACQRRDFADSFGGKRPKEELTRVFLLKEVAGHRWRPRKRRRLANANEDASPSMGAVYIRCHCKDLGRVPSVTSVGTRCQPLSQGDKRRDKLHMRGRSGGRDAGHCDSRPRQRRPGGALAPWSSARRPGGRRARVVARRATPSEQGTKEDKHPKDIAIKPRIFQ
jgi:hypothetical protein